VSTDAWWRSPYYSSQQLLKERIATIFTSFPYHQRWSREARSYLSISWGQYPQDMHHVLWLTFSNLQGFVTIIFSTQMSSQLLSPKHYLANANMTDGKICQKYHHNTYNTVGLLRHVNRSATLTDHVQEVLLSDKGENGDSLWSERLNRIDHGTQCDWVWQ
jgi:hypothetical protein